MSSSFRKSYVRTTATCRCKYCFLQRKAMQCWIACLKRIQITWDLTKHTLDLTCTSYVAAVTHRIQVEPFVVHSHPVRQMSLENFQPQKAAAQSNAKDLLEAHGVLQPPTCLRELHESCLQEASGHQASSKTFMLDLMDG